MVRQDRHKLQEILRRLPLFSELNADELEALMACLKVRSCDRKGIIFQEGDPYHGFYVVAEGQVLVYKLSTMGKMLIMHICRSGDLFADVPMFSGGAYPASAQATQPSTLLVFPQETFEHYLDTHAAVLKKMLRVFALRLRSLNQRLEQLTLHEVTGRLASYLLQELRKLPRPAPLEPCIKLDISKSTLAAHIGTALETLSRTLHKLTDDGILRVRGNKVFIVDLQKLREYAR